MDELEQTLELWQIRAITLVSIAYSHGMQKLRYVTLEKDAENFLLLSPTHLLVTDSAAPRLHVYDISKNILTSFNLPHPHAHPVSISNQSPPSTRHLRRLFAISDDRHVESKLSCSLKSMQCYRVYQRTCRKSKLAGINGMVGAHILREVTA